jgi:DNA-binding NtrC family response regulator
MGEPLPRQAWQREQGAAMEVEHLPRFVPPLVGECTTFRRVKERLPSIARAQRTTLLSGPTGAGKDVVARALHGQSARRDRPYVAVHCAAIPETLVEAEMFGHSRGAFTGATQQRPGLVRSASDGTLFLDEVDSLPATAQAKLLRFLETGEYRPVGSDRVELSSAWVIAATNQDLADRVRQGTFRADLLFRLAVVEIRLPSLRERQGDILALAEHFLGQVSDGTKSFDEAARRALESYDWPGNIRELRHRVEAAAILSDERVITASTLNLDGHTPPPPSAADGHDLAPGGLERDLWTLVESDRLTLAQAIGECERLLVHAALRAEGNNRTRAASRLGIHVRTIFKKLHG